MNNIVINLSKGAVTLFTITALLFSPGQAKADLVGDTVLGTLNSGPTNTNFFDMNLGNAPVPAVVIVPGIEFQSTGLGINVTGGIGADVIQLTMTNNTPFGINLNNLNFLFEDLEWTDHPSVITNVSLIPQSNSILPSTLTWSNTGWVNEIFIGFDGPISLLSGQQLRSRYQITAIQVPEPTTYLLMGSLLGFAMLARRTRQKTTNHVS